MEASETKFLNIMGETVVVLTKPSLQLKARLVSDITLL